MRAEKAAQEAAMNGDLDFDPFAGGSGGNGGAKASLRTPPPIV